jgi:hypothetical protein
MTDAYPIEVLQDARISTRNGAYSEALDKYRWFYENALVYERGLSGVRNSYVLNEWAQLGEVYPPARRELESVRDEKTTLLREGSPEVGLFFDLSSINFALGQVELTSALFAEIAERGREFAQKCFRAALPALVETLDFSLARRFVKPPQDSLGFLARILNIGIESCLSDASDYSIMYPKSLISVYMKNVHLFLDVLVGVGEAEEAGRFAAAAVELVSHPVCRQEIRYRLRSYLAEDSNRGNSE